VISKIINDVVEYCYFFWQSIHSILFHWRLSTDTGWVMYCTNDCKMPCGWSLYEP